MSIPDRSEVGGVADRPGLSLWRRTVAAYRRDGPFAATANALRRVGGMPLARVQVYFDGKFDRRYGTDTRGVIHAGDMPFANPHKQYACNYQPTTERSFKRMMRHLPHSLAGFDFIDIGSGKGRVLFYAAKWDFKRIIGIEFAPPLAALAKHNAAIFARVTGDRRIEVRCEDAVDMVPPDGPCVFFFASPFLDPVLIKVVAQIEASYRAHQQKIYVIYYATRAIPDLAVRFGFLTPIAQGAEWRDLLARGVYPYTVFESRP